MARLLLLLMLLPAAACVRAETFRVSDIRVEGLQRISAGTVFGAIPVTVGDRVDEVRLGDVIRGLFATGYFDDIRVGRDRDVLVITVDERPSISSLELEGNKAIDSDSLLEGLKKSGLAEGQIFKRVTLEHIARDLERQYVSQGRYGTEITAEVEEQQRNLVAIKINISEGKVAGIRHINLVGNSVFSDAELKDVLELRLPGPFSFITRNHRYAREKLEGDLESLESWYQDRGYVNFRIESTHVSISPDRKDVYITINVFEGEKYQVSGVEISGELRDVPEEGVRALVLVAPGQTFSRELVTYSEERIELALGNAGYTFASASGEPEIQEDDTVVVKFFVDAGVRSYVRRIDFRGNTVTQDEVLRREMRQMEGGWASNAAIERSKVRLERLGYFKEVNVETPSVPGTDDQIDVVYTVEEQPSGSISATLGYGQVSGAIVGVNYQEANVFGSGNSVDLGISHSSFQTAYNFSWLDPYFTEDGVSRGFSVYYRKSDFDERNIVRYSTDAYGVNVNFGYPINEISRINFGIGYEHTDLTEGVFPAREISNFLAREGNSFDLVLLTVSYSMSALNRGLLPTGGHSQSLSLELTAPGSPLEFVRFRYAGQIFFPLHRLPLLNRDFNLRLRTDLGYGQAFGGTEVYPFYKHFFAGGLGSVRGYEQNTLGPRSTPAPNDTFSRQDPIGGNVLMEGSAEVLFPLPFVEDQRSLRASLFFDVGNVFNSDCPAVSTRCVDFDLGELRYSTGISLTWITGFAPISLSYSVPLNRRDGDETEVFQFELGRVF